jgi:hypothetical protein
MTYENFKKRVRQLPAAQPALAFIRGQRLRRLRRRAERRPLPDSISIELTNECNLKCAKCPTYDAKRPRGLMAPALYRKIIDDIRSAGVDTSVALSGGGAVLHPSVVDFVAIAAKTPNITSVGFATNGLGLDAALSQQLLDAGLSSLRVSLDAVDASSYLKVNRVDGYDRVVSRRDDGSARARSSSCSTPAGASPVSVSAGAPSSRPQASGEIPVARAGCQEPPRREPVRRPQHEVKLAASSDLQPERRAGHVTAKTTFRVPSSGDARARELGGVRSAARGHGVDRNTRGPSGQLGSEQRGSYKPRVKTSAGQPASEGIVVCAGQRRAQVG